MSPASYPKPKAPKVKPVKPKTARRATTQRKK